MKRDGHIHSPYCPHGSKDTFSQYIEKAIANQFTHITFTEHAPLPTTFHDPTPDQDSGMTITQLQPYLEELQHLKRHYAKHITIHIGLEVDYIAGYEQETKQFLNEYGPLLDDSILSVHFLQYKNEYSCIDFSEHEFKRFANQLGTVQQVYNLYYETVKQSILADLGSFKPKRIGHPTLVHKFQIAHGEKIDDDNQIKETLQLIKKHGLELDFNSAGLSKIFCKETYPPENYLDYIHSIDLPFVFGSDAHTANDLHQHYTNIFK